MAILWLGNDYINLFTVHWITLSSGILISTTSQAKARGLQPEYESLIWMIKPAHVCKIILIMCVKFPIRTKSVWEIQLSYCDRRPEVSSGTYIVRMMNMKVHHSQYYLTFSLRQKSQTVVWQITVFFNWFIYIADYIQIHYQLTIFIQFPAKKLTFLPLQYCINNSTRISKGPYLSGAANLFQWIACSSFGQPSILIHSNTDKLFTVSYKYRWLINITIELI